ncbi:MAG: hypothetical protein ACREP2_13850 [Rhodanobacteraceae bacterium]
MIEIIVKIVRVLRRVRAAQTRWKYFMMRTSPAHAVVPSESAVIPTSCNAIPAFFLRLYLPVALSTLWFPHSSHA